MNDELPPIVALLVTGFHKTEGYRLIWHKSEIDIQSCEYKTIPSGLEKVSEDVIYFTHASCIGLAVYRNLQVAGEEREDFSCITVAILVQADHHNLRHQRLNKIWLYNNPLRELVGTLNPKAIDRASLEKIYDMYKVRPERKVKPSVSKTQSPPSSPVLSRHSSFKNYKSFREERGTGRANETALLPTNVLSELHPVLSLHDCISLFGPLIFPVYRSALARKRIMVLTDAPVQRACHFIYNIQLLSAIPNNAPTMKRPSPLRQLFCLGLNDIPLLEKLQEDSGEDDRGWIGVTTDRVFETKTHLWDLLIRLPPDSAVQSLANERARPTLVTNEGLPIKPSYLDAVNFNKLKPLLPLYRNTGLKARPQPSWKRSTMDSLLSGLWYWASAGQSLQLEETEVYQDSHGDDTPVTFNDEHDGNDDDDDDEGAAEARSLLRPARTSAGSTLTNGRDEVIVLVIFHRFTTSILTMLDELSCESLDDVVVSREKMVRIGLTPRLSSDVALIEDLGRRWFARTVVVDKSFWPCC